MIKRVALGISGGVDSAVSALILKKKGFEVIGVFMHNWDSQDEMGSCLTIQNDLEDAKATCEKLKIEFTQVSFVKQYWNDVFSSLLVDYEDGMTPNADVFCNRFIKFGAFYDYAIQKLGVQAIATGHYARTTFGNLLENYEPGKKNYLLKALDPIKDQTLFLSQIKQEPLQRTMFPLGSLHKSTVRLLAKENGLEELSQKKDSTGICFVGKRNFADFISEYIPNKKGPFIDIDTEKIIGWHNGVHHYTIGQKCGMNNQVKRVYVAHRNPSTQIIRVVKSLHHPALYGRNMTTSLPHWITDEQVLSEFKPFYCMFRFQHADRSVPCQVFLQDNGLRITLAIPLRALTPGQIAVFYKGPICLGSAKILSASSLVDDMEEENSSTLSAAQS